MKKNLANPDDLEIYSPKSASVAVNPVGLSYRCPPEIRNATTLSIRCCDNLCHHDEHSRVIVNGLELCPVSAMLFLIAAKNYFASETLLAAVKKVLECSNGN